MPIHMLIHMRPNIATHASTSVNTIGSLCPKITTRVPDNVTIISITTVRVTITHEIANTKAVLQATLVHIFTVALKLVFCQIQFISIQTFKSILLIFIYTINTGIHFYQMINMCANTNTNTTIVTRPTLCRFSTSDALEGGGFEWAGCYRCFGTCKPDGICLASADRNASRVPKCGGDGKFGNLEICRGMYFPTSQFPKRSQPIWLSTIWEIGKIGKSVEVCTSQFPNFPNNPSPDGPALFGKLGNWEMITSQFPNVPNNPSPDGPALFGKLGNWEPKP